MVGSQTLNRRALAHTTSGWCVSSVCLNALLLGERRLLLPERHVNAADTHQLQPLPDLLPEAPEKLESRDTGQMTGQMRNRRPAGLLRDAAPWVPSGAAGTAWLAHFMVAPETDAGDICGVTFTGGMASVVLQLVFMVGRRLIRGIRLGGSLTLKWGDRDAGPRTDPSSP